MQILWLAPLAVVLIVGAWLLGRAMTSSGRNESWKHGGGPEGDVTGAADYHNLGGGSGDDGP